MSAQQTWHLKPLASEDLKALRLTIISSALSMEEVGHYKRETQGVSVFQCVFQQYFLRNDAYPTLSIMAITDANETVISAIASGGPENEKARIDWTGSKALIEKLDKILEDYDKAN
jgi:hypothetical protein